MSSDVSVYVLSRDRLTRSGQELVPVMTYGSFPACYGKNLEYAMMNAGWRKDREPTFIADPSYGQILGPLCTTSRLP